jgi:hypothetical protein
MPQNTHNRAAELHNLAIHAHQTAAVAHSHRDHLSAHELSKRALEHSMNHSGSPKNSPQRHPSPETSGRRNGSKEGWHRDRGQPLRVPRNRRRLFPVTVSERTCS